MSGRPVGAATDELALRPTDLAAEHEDRAEPETAEWVRRACAGDESAFALIVGRHERMVLRTALRLLGRRDAAQDAGQEAFLRLHRYLRRFDESRELGPWLYRMVVNVCHDLARHSMAMRLVPLDEVREGEHAATRVGPESVEGDLSRERERGLVQAALATLPEKERAAIVLRDIEGLRTAEVAKILGSSEGTVRSQISTARLKIKRFVEAQQEHRS
jgi:RNA polymerase sigma-70 factor, ECF subfamily